MNKRVCHITSAHPANDIRIFHKQTASLAEAGYEVHLVAKGVLPPDASGVIHHTLPENTRLGRLGRMLFRSFKAYRMAKVTQAELFHFHDPELLPYGLLLKLQGYSVIYDAHEDLPRDVLMKTWIPLYFRKAIGWFIEKIENFIACRLDLVVAATPHIRNRFQAIGAKAIDVKNYPILAEFGVIQNRVPTSTAKPVLCYVGVISKERGILEMIHVTEQLNTRLILAGPFIDNESEQLIRDTPGWQNVDFRGVVSRNEIATIFAESQIGLCILHPSITYKDSLPIKLFEYMAAELPVIASNFPIWRDIVEKKSCGLCVDPLNSAELLQAIQWVQDNPQQANIMGKNGREAIEFCYNWGLERDTLFSAYKELLRFG